MTPTSLASPPATPVGLPSPFRGDEHIRAVLFDLDGTLYRQSVMRAAMAMELLLSGLRHPVHAIRRGQALSAFRQAQEVLRPLPLIGSEDPQLARAAARSRMPIAQVERLVDEWMFQRPLKYLPFCRMPGLVNLLDFLSQSGVEIGVFSDYPATTKLAALGIADRVRLVLCSTDPEIRALKPNPRGFLVACRRWGLSPREVLMVGDRADVDGAGASAAGMPCVIVGRRTHRATGDADVLFVSSLERLHRVLHVGR